MMICTSIFSFVGINLSVTDAVLFEKNLNAVSFPVIRFFSILQGLEV